MSMVMGVDGIDDYVNCGANASLNINGANQLTVGVRLKFDTTTSPYDEGIISKDSGAGGFQYGMFRITNVLVGYIHDGANLESAPYYPFTTPNKIVYFTFVLTAARLKLYVDGVEYGAPGTGRTINPQSQVGWSVYVGRYGNGHFMDGSISEAHIYNRDLSAAEVAYNMTHPNNPIRRGCVFNVNQESLSGALWQDLSGNANNGTLVNHAGPIPSNNLAGRNVSI